MYCSWLPQERDVWDLALGAPNPSTALTYHSRGHLSSTFYVDKCIAPPPEDRHRKILLKMIANDLFIGAMMVLLLHC